MRWKFGNVYDSFVTSTASSKSFDSYLTTRGISSTELTAARYAVKLDPQDADAAALVILSTTNGGVTIIDPSTASGQVAALSMQFSTGDFGAGALQIDTLYHVGIGIKTSTMPTFLEPDLDDARLDVYGDFFHD